MTKKLIIACRVNEYKSRDENPHVPFTPDEIAETAVEYRQAGASIIHFHARNPDGSPCHTPEVYSEIIYKIIGFLPPERRIEWTVCCKEGNLFPAGAFAMERGGHVAPGIVDYAYPEIGCPTNAELVRRFADMGLAMGREIATPEETRAMLGIPFP